MFNCRISVVRVNVVLLRLVYTSLIIYFETMFIGDA